jgi:hypothetical protein
MGNERREGAFPLALACREDATRLEGRTGGAAARQRESVYIRAADGEIRVVPEFLEHRLEAFEILEGRRVGVRGRSSNGRRRRLGFNANDLHFLADLEGRGPGPGKKKPTKPSSSRTSQQRYYPELDYSPGSSSEPQGRKTGEFWSGPVPPRGTRKKVNDFDCLRCKLLKEGRREARRVGNWKYY